MKIKILNPIVRKPERAKKGDAGLDLFSPINGQIPPNSQQMINLCISVEFDDKYVFKLEPRSGLALKHGIQVLGGIIDSNYRGEVCVILYNTSNKPFVYKKGLALCQGIMYRIDTKPPIFIEELSDSNRGQDGFGSTDKV